MADQGAAAGEQASGNGETPFRVFQTQEEFDAYEAKIRNIAERKAKRVTGDDQARIDAMEAELEERRQKDLEAKGEYDKAVAAIRTKAEKDVEREKARADKASARTKQFAEAELRAAAAAAGFYDPEDAVVRLRTRIGLDDEFNVVVLGDDGQPAAGLTMEKLVTDLAAAKSHLVKASNAGQGAGARNGANASGAAGSEKPEVRQARTAVEEAKKLAEQNPGDPVRTVAYTKALRALAELEKAA